MEAKIRIIILILQISHTWEKIRTDCVQTKSPGDMKTNVGLSSFGIMFSTESLNEKKLRGGASECHLLHFYIESLLVWNTDTHSSISLSPGFLQYFTRWFFCLEVNVGLRSLSMFLERIVRCQSLLSFSHELPQHSSFVSLHAPHDELHPHRPKGDVTHRFCKLKLLKWWAKTNHLFLIDDCFRYFIRVTIFIECSFNMLSFCPLYHNFLFHWKTLCVVWCVTHTC